MKLLTKILNKFIGGEIQPHSMDEVEFTKHYFEQITKKYPYVTYEIAGTLSLKAITKQRGEVYHYLENAYREYKLEPKEIKEIVEKYIIASGDVYKEQTELDINRIVPMIKPKDYLEVVEELSQEIEIENSPNLVWEYYNEELIIIYAADEEKSISYFHREDFEKLNIEESKLREIAIQNLDRVISKVERSGEKGSYMLIAGGTYEASLILIPDIWNSNNFDVDGETVIAIPNRDLILITGSNNTDQIKRLKETAEESYNEGDHSISPNLFKWNGEKFIDYSHFS